MSSFTKESGRTGHWTKQGTTQAPHPIHVDLGPLATDRNCQVISKALSWDWHTAAIARRTALQLSSERGSPLPHAHPAVAGITIADPKPQMLSS